MPPIYFDAQAGGANDGTTKADAFITIAAAILAWSAGDIIFASHTSLQTGIIIFDLNGAVIISVDFSGSTPPVPADWVRGARFSANTSIADINVRSDTNGYIWGLVLDSDDNINFSFGKLIIENCSAEVSGSGDLIVLGASQTLFIDCDFTLTWANASSFSVLSGHHTIIGGSIGGASDTAFLLTSAMGFVYLKGVDLSALTGTLVIYAASSFPTLMDFIFEGCLFNAGVTVSSGLSGNAGAQLRIYGSSATNQPYYIQEDMHEGTVQSETTIIKTGGSSDGVTPISLKNITNANTESGFMGVKNVMPILFFANTIGNNTFEVDLVTDGLTLTEEDVYMQLMHPQAGVLRAFDSSVNHDAANLPASSATWVTTGLGAPNKQKVSITVNVGQKGWVEVHLVVTRPSSIVYADVKILDGARQYLAGQAYINGEAVPAIDHAAESDVRFDTIYDNGNLTGSAHIPIKSDVRELVPVDNTVGNYVPADEDRHQLGDSYGSLGAEFTGTRALTSYQLPQEVILEDEEIIIFEECV